MALGGKGAVEQLAVRMLLTFYLQNYPAWPSGGTDTWVHTGPTLCLMEPLWTSEKAVPLGRCGTWFGKWRPGWVSISPYWLVALGKTQPDDGLHGQLPFHCVLALGYCSSLTKDLLLQCLGETWRQTVLACLWVGSGHFGQKSPPHL